MARTSTSDHISAGTIKDTVTRWVYQTGHHVDRQFDCHGLAVEYKIYKTLGIKGPKDAAKMGTATYDMIIVEKLSCNMYEHGKKDIVKRIGRWIDFQHDYKTMSPWFMESVWFVFKKLYDKGFVYRGFEVMPYSVGCCIPLSNFEVGQNYKDVYNPVVWVSFPLVDNPTVKLALTRFFVLVNILMYIDSGFSLSQ